MSDFGAEVIAVEMPERGDSLRGSGHTAADTRCGGRSWAGKRSVTVDMHSEAGREIVRGLVRRSDVVAENFRPGLSTMGPGVGKR